MRNWWKLLASGLVSLGGMVSSANAQYAPPGMMPPSGMMPGMGAPGMMTSGMAPGAATGMAAPGAFAGNSSLRGAPADFPNAAMPSREPAAPFSIKDEGMPNAFTELIDNRPHGCPQCFMFRSEYLGWWIQRAPIAVPLVSTTPNFAGGEVGAVGEPNTTFLVPASNHGVDYSMLSGVRLAMGIATGFLPPFEVSGFSFTRNYRVFSDGSLASNQYLARPVQLVDVQTAPNVGLNTVEFVNIPGIAAGDLGIISRLSFWSVETNFFFNFADNGTIRLDFIAGYRHADLYEAFEITNTITGITANVNFNGNTFPTGFTTYVRDSFRTRNNFDGGQIGIRGIFNCNDFKIFLDTKLAMGVTSHYLAIDGSSTLTPGQFGQPSTTVPGGVLALASNSGATSSRSFSLIPETNISLSYQCSQGIRIFGGYDFFYWTNVIRPGDHINNAVDSRQIPTDQNFVPGFTGTAPNPPSHVLRNFFAHGFHVGVEFSY